MGIGCDKMVEKWNSMSGAATIYTVMSKARMLAFPFDGSG